VHFNYHFLKFHIGRYHLYFKSLTFVCGEKAFTERGVPKAIADGIVNPAQKASGERDSALLTAVPKEFKDTKFAV
jgi:hypothetical protein